MPRARQDVTDAELAVLRVLWERGASTRRQLADVLYPGGGPAQYTTVQKLLERLGDKGFVTRAGGAGAITFRAAVGREELIGRRLLDVAEKLCGGSLTPLLMNLVKARPLSGEEIRELHDLVRRLRKPNRPRERPR
jgi:BlaI family transcriptional regulator, penicillinase repressor